MVRVPRGRGHAPPVGREVADDGRVIGEGEEPREAVSGSRGSRQSGSSPSRNSTTSGSRSGGNAVSEADAISGRSRASTVSLKRVLWLEPLAGPPGLLGPLGLGVEGEGVEERFLLAGLVALELAGAQSCPDKCQVQEDFLK